MAYNHDALKSAREKLPVRIYERGVLAQQCREIANTINVDLISFRARAHRDMEESASAASAEQKGTMGVETRRKERRRGRVLVTKEHVAAADAAHEERWRMIGRRISQCTRSRQSRKTDDRSCIDYPRAELPTGRAARVSCLKGFRRIPRKSRPSKHRTPTIR